MREQSVDSEPLFVRDVIKLDLLGLDKPLYFILFPKDGQREAGLFKAHGREFGLFGLEVFDFYNNGLTFIGIDEQIVVIQGLEHRHICR